jgi:hypothetical protein
MVFQLKRRPLRRSVEGRSGTRPVLHKCNAQSYYPGGYSLRLQNEITAAANVRFPPKSDH